LSIAGRAQTVPGPAKLVMDDIDALTYDEAAVRLVIA
jgi:hypothetical protein